MRKRLLQRQWLTLSGSVFRVLAAVALAGCAFVSFGESLTTERGQTVEAPRFLYDDGMFAVADGDAVPRERVVDWWVNEADEEETAGEGGVSAGVRERLIGYRRAGEDMVEDYPDVRGIHIIDDGRYVLTTDKRHVYRYHFAGLILDESVLDWAQIRLVFTRCRSRVRIVEAHCLTADDEVLTLSQDAVRTSSPSRGQVHFDANARSVSATVPGAEVGAVVEYVYEYEKYAPEDWRLFFPGYYFRGDVPVYQSTFEILVPADVPLFSWTDHWQRGTERSWWARFLSFVIPGEEPVHSVTTERGQGDDESYRCYRWVKRRVAPIVKEPKMPPWYEVAPQVHASVMQDWAHLNTLIGRLQSERMEGTPEIRERAEGLTAGLADDAEKTAAIYHWVQKNIRYISVKSSLSSGWTGHPAKETLAQGYGDCTDKSILFATLLEAVGIEAEPVVVRTNDRGRFVPEYPVLACNHCITAVHLNGDTQYLDPTSQDYRYPAFRADNHGVIAYNFIRRSRRTIPVPEGMMANGKQARDELHLRPDGSLDVHSYNRYRGAYEAGLRAGWKRVPKVARSQMMQQHLNGIAPGARLRTFDMGDPEDLGEPFSLEYTYALPNYVSRAGSYRLFLFPDHELRFPEVSLESRRYPLVYTTARAVERTAVLHIPDGLELVDLPVEESVDGRHLSYSEHYERRDGVLEATFRFERTSRRIPVEDYEAYRRNALRIQHLTQKPLYLRQVADG